MRNWLDVVEICAGAGGQSLGLHKAGFNHRLALELDATAALTLRTNLERLQGDVDVRVGDVADPDLWTPEGFEGVDLLAGGVPCPPFSVAGKQLGSQDERDLFAWAVELTGRMKPRALLLENVRGLSMPRFAGYRQAVADRLGDLGYWSEWRLLHASDFGVPQLRPRFVLVAMKEEDASYFHWPEPQHEIVTVGQALRTHMGARGWKHAQEWAENANDVGPTIVGGSKKHGGADLGPTRARQGWARLNVDGRGVADDAPERRAPHYTKQMPRLTTQMVAAVQGWGLGYEWDFVGRKTSVYRQIGNAFPPPVARALGEAIRVALDGSGSHRELDGTVEHDPIYKALRQAQEPISQEVLLSLDPGLTEPELAVRLAFLRRDFGLSVADTPAGPAYLLGDFQAFVGQQDHRRHLSFSTRRLRSRVS